MAEHGQSEHWVVLRNGSIGITQDRALATPAQEVAEGLSRYAVMYPSHATVFFTSKGWGWWQR